MEIHQISPANQTFQSQTLPVKEFEKESFQSKSLTFDFKSRDGDTVHLEYKEAKYSEIKSDEEGKKLRSSLKSELFSYKEAIIKAFIESNGGSWKNINGSEDDKEVAELEAKIPEYWNAENTSQRIVDFATSFLSSVDGENSEFFQTIKAAIKDGFQQAKDMLGSLPGAVGKLTDKTYDLTMEKLDAFESNLATTVL